MIDIHSKLPKKAYLASLKGRRESPFRFGSERFCGYFLGGLFCVTYHCAHEWNRKITGERNTAIGIVQKDGDGCRIRYFIVKGLLAPHYLLGVFVFCLMGCLSVMMQEHIDPSARIFILPISLVLSLVMAGATAIAESFTDQSAEGESILRSILLDPTDLFSYMNNINQL